MDKLANQDKALQQRQVIKGKRELKAIQKDQALSILNKPKELSTKSKGKNHGQAASQLEDRELKKIRMIE